MELTMGGFLCILDYQTWLGCLPLTGLSGWDIMWVLALHSLTCCSLPFTILLLFPSRNMGRKIKEESQALFFIRSFCNFFFRSEV